MDRQARSELGARLRDFQPLLSYEDFNRLITLVDELQGEAYQRGRAQR